MKSPRRNTGFVGSIDGEALGLAVVELGGGRQVEGDEIDPAVGISDLVRLGTRVQQGQPLCRIHAAREKRRGARRSAGARGARSDVEGPRSAAARSRKDHLMARAFVVVMDSVGCGGAPDADRFFQRRSAGHRGQYAGPYHPRLCAWRG